MKTFSSRYKANTITISKLAQVGDISLSDKNSRMFLSETLRNRLLFVISYIVSNSDFIEKFMIVDDQQDEKKYLHRKTLQDISKAELGYDATLYLEPSIFGERGRLSNDEVDDFKLFDLIELLLVFVKKSKKSDVRQRFLDVFESESFPVTIMDWIIVPTIETGILGVAPLIKDKSVRDKIRTIYPYKMGGRNAVTPEAAARISADIVQYIFSSPKSQGDTKIYSQKLIKRVAESWTSEDKTDELEKKLTELVVLAKSFNNLISDVRHTDKHTIQANSPGVYDVIFNLNLSISELVLTTIQDEFVEDMDSETIKQSYLDKYDIKISGSWYVAKKDVPIDLSEIPF
jgi:hypothetical protein